MKTFLKMLLAVVAGLIITGILFFVIMLSVFSGIAAAGTKAVDIPEKSVLVIKTGARIPDRTGTNPLAMFDPLTMSLTGTPGLNDLLKNLRKAAEDDDVSGILIENGTIPSGGPPPTMCPQPWEKSKSAVRSATPNSNKSLCRRATSSPPLPTG